ncbi:NAD-dependent epimerase/dehydratase family protein, partial [Staphylococcus aureus]
HRTKWLAEEEVRRSGIDYVILRPALIIGKTFGRRNSKLVDRYLHLIEKNNSVPLIAGGGNKVQPVFIGDVVAAVVKSLQSATGATINQ